MSLNVCTHKADCIFLLIKSATVTASFQINLSYFCPSNSSAMPNWRPDKPLLSWRLGLWVGCQRNTINNNWFNQSQTLIYDPCHDNTQAELWLRAHMSPADRRVWLGYTLTSLTWKHLLFLSACAVIIDDIDCATERATSSSTSPSIDTKDTWCSSELCC